MMGRYRGEDLIGTWWEGWISADGKTASWRWQRFDPWKDRLASDFYLDITFRNRDGNFETHWLPLLCLWTRNSSAIVMESHLAFQSKSRKLMSTKICAGSIWVMSTCAAGPLLASRRPTLSAAVCTERPGVCSVPSAPWRIQVSPFPVPSAGSLWEQVHLTSSGAWQFSFTFTSSLSLLISYFHQRVGVGRDGRAELHEHLVDLSWRPCPQFLKPSFLFPKETQRNLVISDYS